MADKNEPTIVTVPISTVIVNPDGSTNKAALALRIGCSVLTEDGTICHNLQRHNSDPFAWVGFRKGDGHAFTWMENGKYLDDNNIKPHAMDIVRILNDYVKPEKPVINRITRADVAMFASGDNGMNALDLYQEIAVKSAIYPGKGTPLGVMYCALGLGEAGETQNKVKKMFRDDTAVFEVDELPSGDRIMRFNPVTPERRQQIVEEMGGTLWYLAALADELGTSLSEIAEMNLTKLCDRGERGTLQGDGDNR